MWGGLSYMGRVCQKWAPIYYGTVKVNVANNWSLSFYLYGQDISPYLTNPNDKPLPNILVRGTPYNFSNDEIKPCHWPKRGHMVNFEASHWSRVLLVLFPTHLGVEGFVIYWWDLSNEGGFVTYAWGLSNMGSYILRYRESLRRK